MKIDKAIKQESIYLLIGVVILSAIMEAVFLICGAFDYTVRYKDVLDTEENAIPDVAFAVLLKTMEKVGVKEVYLAGIDGFNETHNGIYLDDEERCDYGIKHTDELNEYVNQMMQRMNKTIKMNLLTKSIYTL